MAELMIGANLKEIARAGRPRVRRGEIRRARPQPAQARRFRRRAEGHQLLGARRRNPRRRRRRGQRPERIDGGAERRDARRRRRTRSCMAGEPIGRLGPTERRARGLCAVPEERNGHAAVGDFTLARQRRAHRAPAHGLHAGRADQRERARRAYADKVIGAFSVKALGPSLDGGLAVGRQLAEIHHGPRNPAGADGARRSASRPGASTRARRPRSARRSSISPGAAARWSSSRRTSTSCWNSAIRWSSSISASLSRVMKVGRGRRSRRSAC